MKRLLLVTFILLCGCSETPEWHELARISFVQDEDELPVDRHLLEYPQFIEFGEDFSEVQGKGVWSHGHEATIRIWAPAESLRVNLQLSTHPKLAAAGQSLELIIDGVPTGPPVAIDKGWDPRTFEALVPLPSVDEGGPHTITLRASVHGNESPETEVESRSPIAFFIRSLDMDTATGPRRFARWAEKVRANVPGTIAPDPVATPMTRVENTDWLVPGTDLPDILFIVLDAARADHFTIYGYPRNTTPNVAALAETGIVFENMFSASAYTLTSTATLFTGHSWATHQLIKPKSVLSEDYLTMADLFGLAGFWTLGMSDNPNVAHSTNLSQGFHEFVETWHAGQDISRRLNWCFDERLAQGIPKNRPAFMYLHALPPHSPYIPEPEHDLWAPEGYDGDVDGSVEQLTVIHDQRQMPGDADRERWISLYDGNLHLADTIAQRLIDSFRAEGRERPLWIVVTSDHGEAFGEHGFYEHLSDVHDEMTHIPFVMWPASELTGRVPDASTFLSNGDVLPLLLAALGMDDLARSFNNGLRTINGARIARDVIPMRSHESSHRFGLRSRETLGIHVGHRGQFFYSLAKDPDQLVNLRRDRAEDYSRWIGDLRHLTLELRPMAELQADDFEPNEADLEALKALGYIK